MISTPNFIGVKGPSLKQQTLSFVNNNQGAWLEPPGGVQLGPELVTNGDFSNGLTGWSALNWTVNSGALTASSAGTNDTVVQSGVVSLGKTYLLTFTCTVSSGSFNFQSSSAGYTLSIVSVSGTYSQLIIPTASGTNLGIRPVSTFTGSIDNISVKEAVYTLPTTVAYQDNTGVTPVTAPTQTVGLLLDQSQGMVLGPELVTNGTFDVDISGVQEVRDVNNIVIPTTNTWESGSLKSARNGADNFGFSIPISVKAGSIYNIKATAIQGTAWRVFVRFSPTKKFTDALYYDYTPTVPFGTRNFSFAAKATTTATWYVIFQCVDFTTNGMYHNFDNISVREVLTTATPGIAWHENIGFTPVSAPGHPVGLLLDQSQGMVLGPELVTNGTFDTDLTGWTTVNSVWEAGKMRVNAISGANFARDATAITTVVGALYSVKATVYANTQKAIIVAGTTSGANNLTNWIEFNTGDGAMFFMATTTTSYVSVGCRQAGVNGGTYCTFDNISVKQVLGNHAYQATAANRPTFQLDSNSLPLVRHDATDYLTVSLPNLGGGVFSASGSVYFATPQGMSALHNQSIGTTYNLPALSTDVYAWCVLPNRLNTAQEAQLERYMLIKSGLIEPDYLWEVFRRNLLNNTSRLLTYSSGWTPSPAATATEAVAELLAGGSTGGSSLTAGDAVASVYTQELVKNAVGAFTFSVNAKRKTSNYIVITFGGTLTGRALAVFDVTNGAVGQTQSQNGYTLVGASTSQKNNGWYRCTITGNITTASPLSLVSISLCAYLTGNTIGNYGIISNNTIGNSVYLSDLQLEFGTTATSYQRINAGPDPYEIVQENLLMDNDEFILRG